jgi:hypothetical protein
VRLVRAALAALVASGLAGCETTQEKSARLEKEAQHVTLARTGLTVTRQSAVIRVREAVVLHAAEGAAVVVVLDNTSARARARVPIAITVSDAQGKTVFSNGTPGLEAGLVSVASLPAHGEAFWVDDQLPAGSKPARVSARVGEGTRTQPLPQIAIASIHPTEGAATGPGVAATASNHSRVAQQSLAVFAIARRSGRIVAAGRALIPELAAGASAPFQLFFVGNAQGAQLRLLAPAAVAG